MRLNYEFEWTVAAELPSDVGRIDNGVLHHHVLPSARLIGDRLNAHSVHSGTDLFRQLDDGYAAIDVRILMQTDDGALIHVAYQGFVEPTAVFVQAVESLTPTEFTDQSIRTTWTLTTGDQRYSWINRAIFIGEGRLRPAGNNRLGMQHKVYRVT